MSSKKLYSNNRIRGILKKVVTKLNLKDHVENTTLDYYYNIEEFSRKGVIQVL